MLRGLRIGLLALLISGTGARRVAAWTQPEFVIGGYLVGGDPNSLTRLNDAGLAFVVASDNASPAQSRQVAARLDSLRIARPGFRMKAFIYVETDRPNTLFKNSNPVANHAAVLGELSGSSELNNASVAGWYIWDEPPIYYPPLRKLASDQIFASIHEMTGLLSDPKNGAGTSGKLPLTNLLSIQNYSFFLPPCSPDTLAAYECYLDGYLSMFDGDSLPAPVISFDKYPFEWPGADFRLSFLQLAAVRDKAAQYSRPNYRIPFWSVIQASPRRDNARAPYRPTPTFNQVRWQAYVSVAYGAKGILYWTLRPMAVLPSVPSYGASFLNRDGTPNGALFDSLAALNAELRGLGPTLMALDPVAVFHGAANRFVLPQRDDSLSTVNSPLQLVSGVKGPTNEGMAGSFKNRVDGSDYVLVANKDTLLAQSFRVTLRRGPRTIERVRKADGRLVPVVANASAFDTGIIAPGGGELFRIVRR
jgi:hypothetical protein